MNRRREHLFAAVSIFGLAAFGFALFVDALGDVAKEEWGLFWNRDWVARATAPHSRLESVVIVVVCLLFITIAADCAPIGTEGLDRFTYRKTNASLLESLAFSKRSLER